MKNRTINIGVVSEVAKGLSELKDQIVFVGGAIISLYADDPAADEIRPTEDVDLTIRLLNYKDWSAIQDRLSELGFHADPEGHAICSYKFNNIPVDIMSTDDGPLGPSNRWYKIGFNELWTVKAKDEQIKVLSAPCYLATKFEAFNTRGKGDHLCHDFEDIIYVLDNRISIVQDIERTAVEIREYLIEELNKIYLTPRYEEILAAHLHPLVLDERLPILIDNVKAIVNLGME
jgi:predicted nucleotidyltransferase